MTQSIPSTAERLLSESDWLRALARQLMREEDRAEDLFQDTVLATLNDHRVVRGPARPWLSRVARNLALRSRRGDDRRMHRERVAAVSEIHVEPVERLEMLRRVVEAVHSMEEPSRTVVLLRFWEDLPPREIAARVDVPVGTVKTQLKRGLQILRARLDGEFGSRQAWIGVLVPVLEYGVTPLASGTGLAAKAGSLLASKKGASTVLLVFLILGGVLGAGGLGGVGDPSLKSPTQTSLTSGWDDARNLSRPDVAREAKGERKQVDPEVSMSEARGFVGLRVVRKGADEPLPNISVNYWNPMVTVNPGPKEISWVKQRKVDLYRVSQGDLQEVDLYQDFGTEYRSNSQGLVWLPQPLSTNATASVIHGHLEGNMKIPIDAGDELHDLELYPVTELTVEVVDRRGNALEGIPVAWKSRLDEHGRSAVKTGVNGGARMRILFAEGSSWIARKGYVVVALPLNCHVAVDLDQYTGEAIRLILPVTGSIDVTLQDVSGQSFEAGFVVLRELKRDVRKAPRPELAWMRLKEGRFSYARVGLGLKFDILVHPDHRNTAFSVSVPGPVSEGEAVHVTVREKAKQRIVSFRLVDVHGIPMADTPVRLSLQTKKQGWSRSSEASIRSDRRGRLQLVLSDPYRGKSHRTLSLVRRTRGWVPSDDLRATIIVDLSRSFPVGLTGLPDVVMAPSPVVVAGEVTTETGESLSDVRVSATAPRPLSGGPDLMLKQDRLQSKSSEDGSFAIRGQCKSSEVTVTAKKKGWFLARPATVTMGTRGVRLAMARTGSMLGQLAPNLPVAQVQFVMVPRVPFGSVRSFPARVQKNSFRFSDLPPGAYEFRVHLRRISKTVFTLPVEIFGGAESKPPLLQGLDLSDQLSVVSITVLDPQQQALTGVKVWRHGGLGFAIETDDSGVARIVCPIDGTDLGVDLVDYQRIHLVGVVSDRVIVMKPPIEVPVRVEGSWPEDGRLTVSFENTAKMKGLWRAQSQPERLVTRNGTTMLRFPAPGVYLINLAFAADPVSSDPGATTPPQLLRFMPPLKVTVRDRSGHTPVLIQINAQGLRQALRSYRSRSEEIVPGSGR